VGPPSVPAPILFGLTLLPPPTLGERRHRSLARQLVAMRRTAPLAFSDRPHPGAALQSNGHQKDVADNDAFSSKWRRFNAEMLARVGRAPVIQG
jgi:hypothetical protein